ncbi:MAG: hypothetical protein M3Q45_08170, partial [Chloroflexota bacterium]|nr:hypothetical protein [Chloroflexota bacterium]
MLKRQVWTRVIGSSLVILSLLLSACAGASAPAAVEAPTAEATTAPAAAEAPAGAAPAEEEKLGASLIGTIEGPDVITDATQFPTTFNEAPMLAEMVAAGTLPPVEERLPEPEDLLVIQPLNEIGQYGGTWRRGFTGPG